MGHIEWSDKDKKPEEMRGFMYGVEYGYHLGHDVFGTPIYPSIQDIYEREPHGKRDYPSEKNWPQDGIVEVEVRFIRHIKAEDCWHEFQKEKEQNA